MTKIRIGNDIKLEVQLGLTNTNDVVNIQSLRAIFVNTTLKNKIEQEYIKKNRFVGRFPIEPFVNEFQPTTYNINSTGNHRYRTFVKNNYCGFGVNPNWNKSMPICDKNVVNYYAEVSRTDDPTTVNVVFPSEAQLYSGVYQLVVIATIAEAGYKNNSRTIIVNYNGVFELVNDSANATDNTVVLRINGEVVDFNDNEPVDPNDPENQSDPTNPSKSDDVYVVSGYYNNNSIRLRRTDSNFIDIDISPLTDWHEGD